ncbi:RNA polymerase sigma factor [Clostridium uliginosum]|uniref:RNA polymerase sigma-70 factor, ECF subfamily n=1 Tax=Clostridium uliginosum TaxID=119641 RepID=A0A1I1IZ29_9CLOT|nr:RNA polymerase sigma factor [Clostridium uliginosum]SFC38480.1 RNA polymerase sigma-70 factor, ECF subfamily [Clostridium uliginosum]
MSETELVEKIQSGDMNALGEIFEIYKNQGLKYAYLITGSRFTSEDIVQETFIKCYLSAKSLKNAEQFKPWFFKILTRIAWKHTGKERKTLPFENIFEKANDESIDKSIERYIRNQEAEALHAEIEHLDLKQKTVVVLFYFNGLTVKEIAKIMGCFEGTVKSRLYSARKKLKLSLLNNEECEITKAKECEVNG